MKQLRYIDYDCPSCSISCTRFVYFDTETQAPLEEQPCSNDNLSPDDATIVCSGVLVPREMAGVGYMKTISKANSDFSERERARLEKRQDAHWKRAGRDEAIDRERAFFKKHNAVGGVK